MLSSFSALDAWLGLPPAGLCFMHHEGDLVSLANGQDNLVFAGLPYADACQDSAAPDRAGQMAADKAPPPRPPPTRRYQCSEGSSQPAHSILKLRHDPARRYFDLRGGLDAQLSAGAIARPSLDRPAELILFETALLAARYDWPSRLDSGELARLDLPAELPALFQQDLLRLLLDSPHPEKGFEILRQSAFLERFWPELFELTLVDQTKDFHPEGDAWRHTMETFSHRKSAEPVLALGLLLHDIGKASATGHQGRRFDGHANIGGQQAVRFLSRLGFDRAVTEAVHFLVRYHMMPAALPELPVYRVEEQLRNPLFPLLLELYRCDELSTFRGPDGYFAACSAYQDWCRHTRNPYRLSDGRRLPKPVK